MLAPHASPIQMNSLSAAQAPITRNYALPRLLKSGVAPMATRGVSRGWSTLPPYCPGWDWLCGARALGDMMGIQDPHQTAQFMCPVLTGAEPRVGRGQALFGKITLVFGRGAGARSTQYCRVPGCGMCSSLGRCAPCWPHGACLGTSSCAVPASVVAGRISGQWCLWCQGEVGEVVIVRRRWRLNIADSAWTADSRRPHRERCPCGE